MPQLTPNTGTTFTVASPNYVGLVKFLVQPFLESPESLSVDCEMSATLRRAWIRLAFEGADKGRVFGRGGRNIQAIRTVITAVAAASGQSVYLDIYGSAASGREGALEDEEGGGRLPMPRSNPRRTNVSRPSSRPRSRPV